MKKTFVVKQLATLMISSLLAMSLVGCKSEQEQKEERAEQTYKEWVKNQDYKPHKSNKSDF